MSIFRHLRLMGLISSVAKSKGPSGPAGRTILQVEPMEDRTVPSTLIPVSNHRDLVYDPLRRLLDITSGGSVLQWNPGTQALTTLVSVGGTLNGADISPDGSTLYFAQQQTPGTQGRLFAFNLNSFQMVPAGYSPVSGEGAPWDVSVASNGTALFDSISTTTTPVPVRQLTLGSNVVTIRTDDPGSAGGGRIQPKTLIHRSADHSLVLFTEPNNTAGPFFTYNASTNTFGPRINFGVPLNNLMSAVNRNGTLMALDTGSQLVVMDNHYAIRNQFGGLDGGVVFDPNQDVMYAVWPSGDQIVAFDTNTWAVKYQLPIGEPVGPSQAFGNGVMAVSSDSSMLFLSTTSGVRVISLPTSGPAVQLAFSGYPQVSTAGTANTFTVTALDANGQIATGYTGTISFFSSDSRAVLPAKYTFTAADAGVHTFSAAFKTAGGNQYIAAQDTVTGSIQGGEGAITVNPGPVSQFAISAPTTPQPVGYAIPLTVAAEDSSGNIITNYGGTVHFVSSDPAAWLPADYTFTANDRGVHTFSAIPKTAGNQSFSVSDRTNSNINGMVTVPIASYVPGLHFSVNASPASNVAGAPFTVTVIALDTNNNVGIYYNGTVSFSAVAGSVLPANYTFTAADQGVHTFTNGATLFKAGNQTITVHDVTFVTGGQTGSGSGTVTITPAAASTLQVSGCPTSATADVPVSVTVTAVDAYGNVATNYAGPIHFTASDWRTVLPADSTLTNGTGTFSITFRTVGTQTFSVWDSATGTPMGPQTSVTVNPGPATGILENYGTTVTAGAPLAVTITAIDSAGNTAPSYRGTIQFTSSDARVTLPANYTFTAADNGVHTFTAVLRTAGAQYIAATDYGSFSYSIGTQANYTVTAAAAAQFLISAPSTAQAGVAFNLTLTVEDAYGNVVTGYTGTVHFSSSDQQAGLPADYTFGASDAGVHTFSVILQTPGMQTITIADTQNGSLTGSVQVSL